MTELLKIKQLSVELQGKTILSGINLSLAAGDIMGLVGPSGCGKTTLLNTIAGFIEQCQGDLVIDGKVKITPGAMIAPEHRNIGMIFQDYALFPHLTVEQNIIFGIETLTKSEQQARLSELVELLKLSELTHRYPHQLSGGQQQRVAIARALAPRPKLLLLDEPFSNIDARLRNELMVEIRQLLKHLDITAIFVTHNKDEVFTFADKIAVMHQGDIIQSGQPANVCQRPNSWQVADFLQLGSWLPLKSFNGYTQQDERLSETTENKETFKLDTFLSALGELNIKTERVPKQQQSLQLLLKPQFIELCSDKQANAQVNHITVTEQGYHYLLSSLVPKTELAFEQLSFYSEVFLTLGQQVSINIKPHTFMVYSKANS